MSDGRERNLINHYLSQRVIELIATLLNTTGGRARFAEALAEQWPATRGAPNPTAIHLTLQSLADEKTLEILVCMVPRLEFIRNFTHMTDEKSVSFLSVTSEGAPAFLLVDDVSADDALSATIDMIVSELAAVATIHDVLIDHTRLRALTESIAYFHADKVIQNYLHAVR